MHSQKNPLLQVQSPTGRFSGRSPHRQSGTGSTSFCSISNNGNCHLLVLVDYLTHWVEVYPLPDQCAETVAQKMMCDFICWFGKYTVTRNAILRAICSKEVCQLLEVVPYHSSAKELLEHFNHTLGSMIRGHLDASDKDWDLYVSLFAVASRATVHPSTGFTPNFLMLGREQLLPLMCSTLGSLDHQRHSPVCTGTAGKDGTLLWNCQGGVEASCWMTANDTRHLTRTTSICSWTGSYETVHIITQNSTCHGWDPSL